MSTEFELPAELKSLQQKLKQTPLPEASVDRDALMYRAGWAAARQRHGAAGRSWLPTATATIAATVVFVLMTVSSNVEETALAPSATTNEPRLAAPPTPHEEPWSRTTRLARDPWNHRFMIGSMRSDAPYRQPLPEVDPPVPSKTSRELLQELLPELKRPRRPWRAFS